MLVNSINVQFRWAWWIWILHLSCDFCLQWGFLQTLQNRHNGASQHLLALFFFLIIKKASETCPFSLPLRLFCHHCSIAVLKHPEFLGHNDWCCTATSCQDHFNTLVCLESLYTKQMFQLYGVAADKTSVTVLVQSFVQPCNSSLDFLCEILVKLTSHFYLTFRNFGAISVLECHVFAIVVY